MPAETDDRDLYHRILAAIDGGDYPPGARLLEAELATIRRQPHAGEGSHATAGIAGRYPA